MVISAMLGSGTIADSDANLQAAQLDFTYSIPKYDITPTSDLYLIIGGGLGFSHYGFAGNNIDVDVTITMYGFMGGFQYAIKSNEFIYYPFFLYRYNQAESTTHVTAGDNYYEDDFSTSFATQTFGFDMIYRPTALTFSFLYSIAEATGSNDDEVKITTISVGKKF